MAQSAAPVNGDARGVYLDASRLAWYALERKSYAHENDHQRGVRAPDTTLRIGWGAQARLPFHREPRHIRR